MLDQYLDAQFIIYIYILFTCIYTETTTAALFKSTKKNEIDHIGFHALASQCMMYTFSVYQWKVNHD